MLVSKKVLVRSGGRAEGRQYSDDTGQLYFFDDANLELMVKVLDGRPVNGHFWVFYGSLTDVEFDLTVTDTSTGISKTYHNPPGEQCGRADTQAF